MNHSTLAIFGEVLFDYYPDGHRVLGGAPFNVAWHTQAFGLKPYFISRVGCDANAASIQQAMQEWGMSLAQLQTDNEHPTGVVQISFNNGEPSYDIVANQAYDFIAVDDLDLNQHYNILYHGTLALRNPVSAQALAALKASRQGKIFVDVNLRAPWWQLNTVKSQLQDADWVKLNEQELQQLQPFSGSLKTAMQDFLSCYSLQVLVVTRGKYGAMAVSNTGEFINVKPSTQLNVVDTVGAGDAFAAVLLLGLQRGWTLAVTMNRAQAFASALVTQRGAIVQDRNFYQPFIAAWYFNEDDF
jgi:fructokinase